MENLVEDVKDLLCVEEGILEIWFCDFMLKDCDKKVLFIQEDIYKLKSGLYNNGCLVDQKIIVFWSIVY